MEKTGTGYSAYAPDVPCCVEGGATREEVEQEMREAIAFHFNGLRAGDAEVPEPHTYATHGVIAA